MKRNGKIARVPGTIRAELNLRMEKGEEGETLLAWLNGLPAVQETLKARFEGAPISKQNLSEWRLGGFREWQLRQEWMAQASDLADSVVEMEEVVDLASLPGALAGLLAVRYAALLNGWDGEPDPKFEEKLKLLRGMNRDIALLQRTLQRASEQEREIEQESEERERREFEEKKKRTLDILWSIPQTEDLARVIGGGKQGRKLAEMITAVENDLPLPKATEEGKRKKEEGRSGKAQSQRRGHAGSKRVQPSEVQSSKASASSAEAFKVQGPVKPSQSESNPVKPGEAGSSPDMSSHIAEASKLNEDSDAGREARPAARDGACAPRKQEMPPG